MAKWIHNLSDEEKIYQGRPVAAGAFFEIAENLKYEYMQDETLLADLLTATVKMSANGTSDLSGSGSKHIDFLKGIDPSPRDADGAIILRQKAAQSGWKAQFHAIRLSTATTSGVHNKDRNGNDLGFCTYTMYDSQDQVTVVPAECVKTVVTWEPTHDMEIVGGRCFQKQAPNTDVWMYVTAAAHIPVQYGGSIEFLQGGMNLKDVADGGEVDFDGRAAKFVAYDAVYHSGRFEILLKHDAGVQHSFSLVFELFKP